MSEVNGCEQPGQSQEDQVIPKLEENDLSEIKNVIAVMSGKGGVGKSLVSVLIAQALNEQGFKVGIMDGDLTGPSIPHLLNLTDNRASSLGEMLLPETTENNIKVMSINLLLERETDPVIWRGPIIAQMIDTFWSQVAWGELDYMIVDMPPGTGDVPLTVFQKIPVNGIVVVTSPAELVSVIVTKAVKMADKLEVPILGLIENMAYLECPDCHAKISMFGESHVEETARANRLPLLDQIPLDPELSKASDQGKYDELNLGYVDKTVTAIKKATQTSEE